MMSLSRRTLLMGGAAGVVVAGTGIGGWRGSPIPRNILVRAVIRDRFPDIRMTEDDSRPVRSRFSRPWGIASRTVDPALGWIGARLCLPNEGLRARLPRSACGRNCSRSRTTL